MTTTPELTLRSTYVDRHGRKWTIWAPKGQRGATHEVRDPFGLAFAADVTRRQAHELIAAAVR